jgi:hypothetical protein
LNTIGGALEDALDGGVGVGDCDEASQEHRNKSQAQQEWGVMMADADALNTADERCSKPSGKWR